MTVGGPRPDPREEAERRFRQHMAREAAQRRDTLRTVTYAGWGCLTLIVIVMLVAFLAA